MPVNILFITWDGPQTSYMEGLFLPIFHQIQKENKYCFHVIQFTWGTNDRIAITQKKANELGIKYTYKKIHRKPYALLGSLFTILGGTSIIREYINTYKIDIVMPRSTMPSIMVNRLSDIDCKILLNSVLQRKMNDSYLLND